MTPRMRWALLGLFIAAMLIIQFIPGSVSS